MQVNKRKRILLIDKPLVSTENQKSNPGLDADKLRG